MKIERTTIRRLSGPKKTLLLKNVLSETSAFTYYLENNTPNVSVVIFWSDEGSLMAWGCLDHKGAYVQGLTSWEAVLNTPLMGWYVNPVYRRTGLGHQLAIHLPCKKHIVAEGKNISVVQMMNRLGYERVKTGIWLDRWVKKETL